MQEREELGDLKREKDVKRGKNKEKSMCMEKKERKINICV
jgi:hypothetical protein